MPQSVSLRMKLQLVAETEYVELLTLLLGYGCKLLLIKSTVIDATDLYKDS